MFLVVSSLCPHSLLTVFLTLQPTSELPGELVNNADGWAPPPVSGRVGIEHPQV